MPIPYSMQVLTRTVLLLSWPVLAPALAHAELFADLYAGATLPGHAAASHTQTEPIAANLTRQSDFGVGPTLGLRAGYWFARFPWLGVAGDLSYFSRSAEGAKVTVVPMSLLIMLRWPLLTSEEHPTGQLQPYVGIGPALFIGDSSIDVAPLTKVQDGSFTTLGADARAGLLWKIHKHVGIFGEYRFTYFGAGALDDRCPPEPQSCGEGKSLAVTIRKTDLTLASHHVLVGLRFTFSSGLQ